jgi:tRNA uridine 5-carbamoylmethylation protein Kti12
VKQNNNLENFSDLDDNISIVLDTQSVDSIDLRSDTIETSNAKIVSPSLDSQSSILLLPVCLPGSGKSSFCRYLVRKFGDIGLGVNILERDVIFSRARGQAKSLKQTRQVTHDTILQSLSGSTMESNSILSSSCLDSELLAHAPDSSKLARPIRCSVVCVDSTNGNQEARDLYASQSRSNCVFIVVFTMRDAEILLERCLKRENHPGFPSDVEDARRKIRNIADSFEWPEVNNDSKEVEGLTMFRYEVQSESDWNGVVDALFMATLCTPSFTARILQ